jgi:hypothetical protein
MHRGRSGVPRLVRHFCCQPGESLRSAIRPSTTFHRLFAFGKHAFFLAQAAGCWPAAASAKRRPPPVPVWPYLPVSHTRGIPKEISFSSFYALNEC